MLIGEVPVRGIQHAKAKNKLKKHIFRSYADNDMERATPEQTLLPESIHECVSSAI